MGEGAIQARHEPEPIHSAEKHAERRAERIDEVNEHRLRRAHAAVRVEQFFRDREQRQRPDVSLLAILDECDLAADEVDKEFLRVVAAVAERYARVVNDTRSVMFALEAEAIKRRGVLSATAYGEIMLETLSAGRRNIGAASLERRNGVFILRVENDDDYNALYNERGAASTSAGRFHHAVLVHHGNREVPVIVVRGFATDNDESEKTIVHEVQHWINQGLVKLDSVDSLPARLLSTPLPDVREEILWRREKHIAIKDEILAYLREGATDRLSETLSGDLYRHLFSLYPGGPLDPKLLQVGMDAAKAVETFGRMVVGVSPEMNAVLVYALIDVPLEKFPKHISALKETFSRVYNEFGRSTRAVVEARRIKIVPRRYRADLQLAEATFAVQERLFEELENWTTMHERPDRGIKVVHDEIATNRVEQLAVVNRLARDGVRIPSINEYALDTLSPDVSQTGAYELLRRDMEDVLDRLASLSQDAIDDACATPSDTAKTSAVRALIAETLRRQGATETTIFLTPAASGAECYVRAAFPGRRVTAEMIIRLFASPDRPVAAVDALPTVMAVEDEESSYAVVGRKHRAAQTATFAALAAYDAQLGIRAAAQESDDSPRLWAIDKKTVMAKREYENARVGLFRNGCHVPVVDFTSAEYRTLHLAVFFALNRAIERLADAADAVPQSIVDEAYEDATDAPYRAITQALETAFAKHRSSGKLRDLVIDRSYVRHGRLVFPMVFLAQERNGGWRRVETNVTFFPSPNRVPVAEIAAAR